MQDRIQKEYTRSSAESGGDSSAVDEFACMERALGHRCGHIRGVGRVIGSSRLSHHRVRAEFVTTPSSISKALNHINSATISARALYSDYVDDRDTVFYL
ncbi:hypothetical protein L1987_84373 [Smallanthus sonchifolius]|uniref:Uncharacterized protein n=1 Tax=Smallanthus sonchifolius TaxID=185202 RepID=A0ACB8YEQ8_9ASTR|nr:hypothetical protein L1987_84373 [Smallanthus sonchifolius]